MSAGNFIFVKWSLKKLYSKDGSIAIVDGLMDPSSNALDYS